MRKSRRLVMLAGALLGALLSSVSWAQQPASISGSVVNSLTGAPVARAHVSVQNQQKRFGAMTDGSGNFTITGLDAGTVFVTVDRLGFANSRQPNPVQLGAGENKTGVDLKLVPTGGITGTIYDPDGQPVQMAQVWAEGPEEQAPATTDSRGRYRIGGLNPGKYRIKAQIPSRSFPPEIRTDGTRDVHYPALYYPGVISAKAAGWVKVEAGQDTQAVDLRLAASPIVKLAGKVLNAPTGVKVEVGHSTGPYNFEEQDRDVESDGSFVVWGLDPDKYTLKARVGYAQKGPQSAPLEIEVGTTDIEGIVLQMVEPFDISGRIQFEDEQARAKAEPPKDAPAWARTQRVTLQAVPSGNTLNATIGPDSTFHVEKAPPGRYRVRIESMGGFVKSLSWGAAQVDGNVLDTQNGSPNSELVLTISGNTGQISGTVTDSNGPVPHSLVNLLTDGRGGSMGTSTDATGRYTIDNLAPGSYSLFAPDKSIAGTADFRSEFSEYEDSMTKLEVYAGDKITQDLKLVTGEK